MAKYGVPGMTIGFVKDNQMWVRGFGLADIENRVAATDSSAYRLASIQKSMTAVAVLQLAERGKLDLDAEIQTYVPYFPKKKYPITARELLGHLGGIPHYVNRDVEQHITVRLSMVGQRDHELRVHRRQQPIRRRRDPGNGPGSAEIHAGSQ